MNAPAPFRFDLMVPIRVRCSAPDCLESAELPTFPMLVFATDGIPSIDRAEVAAGLPTGWKVGAMIPQTPLVQMPNQPSMPPGLRPMPVAFCPTHNPEK